MKKFLLGLGIFIIVSLISLFAANASIVINISGVIGLIGIVVAGFLKTGFSGRNSSPLGNSAIIELDEKLNLSSTLFLIALPNLLGSLLLLLFFK
ncbi:hypothetical protein GH741_10610 [Aquibacillus halophilus]|uniref:DUF5316 domain-containing protein n=1 Tax=Aquibacillus halophilus TaxID=930132 RepID=A0A6A8DHE8_9BACI|nr:hypothetical protein [Aquibacillus halophilus]MRH43131.1 hypothetical protein [Aquibacillus halophilus]